MMAFGQSLIERLANIVHTDEGAYLKKSTKNEHIEYLGIAHSGCSVHCINFIYMDITSFGTMGNTKGIIDKCSSRTDMRKKSVQ